mgnify:CR=1 FL=1
MEVLNPKYDASKSVAYTGTAGTTAAFTPGVNAVMVWATTDCYVKVGESVTATSDDLAIPAFTPVLIRITTQNPYVVSAIQISASGTVYANPMNGATA